MTVSSDVGIFGIQFVGAVTGTVTHSTVRGEDYGVSASGATVTVEGNTLDRVGRGVVVVGAVTGTVRDNTITGLGTDPDGVNGVLYSGGAGGEVSGNTISDFRNVAAGTGCGIRIAADAGAATFGLNTFPPPGNTQDVCDDRP